MSELEAFFDVRREQPFECALVDGQIRGSCEGIAPLIVERRGEPARQLTGTFALPFDAQSHDVAAGATDYGAARRWVPMNPRQLRRRQRIIRFRRLAARDQEPLVWPN